MSLDGHYNDSFMLEGLNAGYMPSGLSQGPPGQIPTMGMHGGVGPNQGYMSSQSCVSMPGTMGSYPPSSMSSGYVNPYMQFQGLAAAAAASTSPTLARALAAVQQTQKRPRSEKKPIPSEQKDTKYFERRRRNNQAAKKSRDARKAREDEIAIRASFLEKENAILRAQVATLREEANSLKQLLLQKRSR